MKQLFLFIALCTFLSNAVAAINVDVNGQQFRYLNPVRLSLVLRQFADKGDWYWPACTIYNADATEIEAKRQAVIKQIDALVYELRPRDEKAIALAALRRQVESWTLAKRLPVSVNYDAARLDIKQNPMLQEGNYLLRLTGRPGVVWMSGMVKTPGAYEYQSSRSPYHYASGIAMRDYADPDFVYVISPEGDISKHNIAYWNKSYAQIIPGSQIYAPLFTWLLSPDVDELNQAVVELAVHRVLP